MMEDGSERGDKLAADEPTPAMIEAGILALLDFDVRNDELEWVVTAIWAAMDRVDTRHASGMPAELHRNRPPRRLS